MLTVYDVLGYPERKRNNELIQELDTAGIELFPVGKKQIFGVPVLGKGWSSIVVYGLYNNKKVAVKIQRKDSNRLSLGKEAHFLTLVNNYAIGPRLFYQGKSFLVLEYLDGTPIRESPVKKKHIKSFFQQCHALDLLKIDHGQIQGGKHLIIGKKCYIIDFEKAGYRTPKNVSSLVSELFLRKTAFARELAARFLIDTPTLMKATRQYKSTGDLTILFNALHW